MKTSAITTREKEILHLVAYEHSTKEIAAKLYISNLTVMTHRRNLMLKMRVKNTAGLVRKGYEYGILQLESKFNVVASLSH